MFYYLLLTLFLLLIVDLWKRWKYRELNQVIGIDCIYVPFIGHAYKFLGNNETIYTVMKKAISHGYNRKHGTGSGWLGNELVVGTLDPIEATTVLKTAFNKTLIYKLAFELFGNSTVFAPATIWHRRRKILAPTFAPRFVNKFIEIFEKNAKLVVQLLEPKVGRGNFSCWDLISNYALDSVCETTLGVDINVLRNPDQPFVKAYEEIFKIAVMRLFRPWLHIDFLYKLLPVYSRQQHTKQIIHEFIDNIIYKKEEMLREKVINKDKIDNGTNNKSFLELMIEGSEETGQRYTHEELREESLLLVLAGTDTTSTGLCFTMVMLSQHQDVQENVYKEIKEVLGEKNYLLDVSDLPKLKYMEAVIKETLRLYPPVSAIVRDSELEFILRMFPFLYVTTFGEETYGPPNASGVNIPKGCNIITSIAGINCNPHYWGTDADSFKPERFLSKQTLVPGAFMSFSYGPRNCIGYSYAMMSMKTVISTILRQYRLLPATSFKYDESTPLRLSYEFMTKHVDNYEIQLEYRH